MPSCPDCGAGVRPDDRHCRSCGYGLRDSEQSQQRPTGANGSGWGHSRATDPGWGSQQYDESGRSHEQTRQRDQRRNQRREHGQRQAGTPARSQTATPARGRTDQPARQRPHRPQKPGRGVSIEGSKALYSLRFPFSGGPKPLAYGTLWQSIGELLIPILPVLVVGGYTARVSEAAAWGDRVQPGFGDFGDLLREGFFHSLLGLAWMGTMVLVGIGAVLSFDFADELAGEPVTTAVLVVGLAAFLFCVYLGPAMLTLPAVSGRPSVGISPGRIRDFAFTKRYFRSFLLYLLLCGLLLGSFLALAGVGFWAVLEESVGLGIVLLLVAFVAFFVLQAYFNYFSGAFWGATYYEAVQEEVVTDLRNPSEGFQQHREVERD